MMLIAIMNQGEVNQDSKSTATVSMSFKVTPVPLGKGFKIVNANRLKKLLYSKNEYHFIEEYRLSLQHLGQEYRIFFLLKRLSGTIFIEPIKGDFAPNGLTK